MFKFKFALLVAFLVLLGVAVPNAQASSASPPWMAPYEIAQQGLPTTVAGYRVLAVLTPDNTACMPPGRKLLVLQATQPLTSIEDDMHSAAAVDAAIRADLEQKGLGEYAKLYSIGGPGMTLDQFISQNQSWNEQRRKYGCVKTGPAATGTDYQEFKEASGSGCCAGYAAFEDTDAGVYTDAYAQSVYLESPAAIANRPLAVAFENNVQTNGSVFTFLQVGMDFWYGVGRVIWTDTAMNYVDQQFGLVPYLPFKTYYTGIMYNQANAWRMCSYGMWDPNHYWQCINEGSYSGTTLGLSINTSIWFENHNTDPNWYNGFSSPFWAYGAQIDRWYGGTGHVLSWSTQHHHTEDHCAQNYDPHNALGGTLIGGYGAGYFLDKVPLVCP